MHLIDECIKALNSVYQQKTDEASLNESLIDENLARIPTDKVLTPEYETSEDGLTLKLSPRGRIEVRFCFRIFFSTINYNSPVFRR